MIENCSANKLKPLATHHSITPSTKSNPNQVIPFGQSNLLKKKVAEQIFHEQINKYLMSRIKQVDCATRPTADANKSGQLNQDTRLPKKRMKLSELNQKKRFIQELEQAIKLNGSNEHSSLPA